MPRKRRHKGEGASYRTCAEKYGCPPTELIDGKRVRPEHEKNCKAPWAMAIDRGMVAGRRDRKVITAKTKAELAVKVAQHREREVLGVDSSASTVADWLDFWIERVAPVKGKNGLRETTRRGYKSKIELYLKPFLGKVRLQDLNADHIDRLHEWMRTLDKSRLKGAHGPGELSDTTIRQAHMVLRSALDDAVARRKITYNPAAVVKAPQAALNPHPHFELDDAKKVIMAARNERELCRLVVALGLGIRQGEALGLRWTEYRKDADGYYLLVEEAVQRVNGRLVRTDVKSRASHRRVPIPERYVPIFEAWRALATDAYIFPGPNGGPCDSKLDWKVWRDTVARTGLPHKPPHGARGSTASILGDSGVPDWLIAEILGQSQVTTTRRHYLKGTDAAHRTAIGGLAGGLIEVNPQPAIGQ